MEKKEKERKKKKVKKKQKKRREQNVIRIKKYFMKRHNISIFHVLRTLDHLSQNMNLAFAPLLSPNLESLRSAHLT